MASWLLSKCCSLQIKYATLIHCQLLAVPLFQQCGLDPYSLIVSCDYSCGLSLFHLTKYCCSLVNSSDYNHAARSLLHLCKSNLLLLVGKGQHRDTNLTSTASATFVLCNVDFMHLHLIVIPCIDWYHNSCHTDVYVIFPLLCDSVYLAPADTSVCNASLLLSSTALPLHKQQLLASIALLRAKCQCTKLVAEEKVN